MVSLRLALWILLSVCLLAVALVLIVVSRSVPALDHGWVNAFVILAGWLGCIVSLGRSLIPDPASDAVAIHRRVTGSALHAHRR